MSFSVASLRLNNLSTIKTPGVYIEEKNAFPNSVIPVATAVPAFVGYTPQAMYEGKSYTNVPTKITSFADFQKIFCYPDLPTSTDPVKQYNPQYYLVKQNSQPEKGGYVTIQDTYYSVVPDPNTIYYLYNSIRLFYQNGGGDAYIVSVGTYGSFSGTPIHPGDQIVNPNVQLNELMNGFALLKNEKEPTMYICPEATLLSIDNNATLMQKMLLQSSEMKTAISIFDIIGGRNPDPILYTNDIQIFRNSTGSSGLDFGTAYYPFIGTTIMQKNDIDYTNLFGGDIMQLESLLNPSSDPNQITATILSTIKNPPSHPLQVSEYNQKLLEASTIYKTIINHVLADVNILPPSGGMAGVITQTDNNVGPWQAPANTSIVGASSLPIRLSESQQANLNVDAVSGKSINAIRFFNGIGILVWGARTLEGNSQDWRYISVRRTMIMIEQSIANAAFQFVFAPNDASTWTAVEDMLANFLHNLWTAGCLQGASPADAYSISCGLGKTMTPDDILKGIMRVQANVAIVHPAEFIVITYEQQMAKSS